MREPPSIQGAQGLGNAEFAADIKVESEHLAKLAEQKTELLTKVQTLKKELTEWRTKLDGQVKSFRGVSWQRHSAANTQRWQTGGEGSVCFHNAGMYLPRVRSS